MLVLARREGQGISIGDQIKVVVIGIKGAQVKIGVKAPGDVAVHRDEVYARIAEQNRSSTLPTDEAVDGLREPHLRNPSADVSNAEISLCLHRGRPSSHEGAAVVTGFWIGGDTRPAA